MASASPPQVHAVGSIAPRVVENATVRWSGTPCSGGPISSPSLFVLNEAVTSLVAPFVAIVVGSALSVITVHGETSAGSTPDMSSQPAVPGRRCSPTSCRSRRPPRRAP